MSEEIYEARSIKFDGKRIVILSQLSSGNFAMYLIGGMSSPFWVGPASDIPSAYANRPEYNYIAPAKPKIISGLDISKLDFNI